MSKAQKIIFGTMAIVCGLLLCSGMAWTLFDGMTK